MFSQTTEYALRAVVWLASHAAEGPVGSQRIAEEIQVSPTYLSKVLLLLAEAEIVDSRRGAGGGYSLRSAAENCTILDVVNAVDPIDRFEDCPLRLSTHKKKRCAMHASLNEATDKMREVLEAQTIQDILADKSRPLPLSNQKH